MSKLGIASIQKPLGALNLQNSDGVFLQRRRQLGVLPELVHRVAEVAEVGARLGVLFKESEERFGDAAMARLTIVICKNNTQGSF